jgi:pimeloyl-ACP methyl ester carboxylesterase
MQHIIELTSPATLCGTLMALAARTDTLSSLANIKCPTLIMVGEKDGLIPRYNSDLLHNKIAKSQFRLITKAGHLSNLENPITFNHNLRSFLDKLNS